MSRTFRNCYYFVPFKKIYTLQKEFVQNAVPTKFLKDVVIQQDVFYLFFNQWDSYFRPLENNVGALFKNSGPIESFFLLCQHVHKYRQYRIYTM